MAVSYYKEACDLLMDSGGRMARFHHRKQKAGLPPGTVVFVGEHPDEEPELQGTWFTAESIQERRAKSLAELGEGEEGLIWLNLDGVHQPEQVRALGDRFGFHPLVQEDIANTMQRPKIEVFDDYLFIVMRMLSVSDSRSLESEQVSMIVGKGYLLTFQEQEGDVFEPVRQRLRSPNSRIRSRGVDYLAYALIDVIIDHYFHVLEHLDEQLEELEDLVVAIEAEQVHEAMRPLRRELQHIRRTAWSTRDALLTMTRIESALVQPETAIYLRDAHDHTIQVVDIVEGLREMVASLHDLHMSTLSNRMNEVVKTLTIIGTIFIPLTFIAGVYGMNFEYMPELGYRYAYFMVLGGMGLAAGGLLWYFWEKEWI